MNDRYKLYVLRYPNGIHMTFIALQPSINNSSLTKKSVLMQPWSKEVSMLSRKGMLIGGPSHTSSDKFTNPSTLYTCIVD
jgi:hypothetical protein